MSLPISRIQDKIYRKHPKIDHHDNHQIDHEMRLECIETHPDDESQIEYDKRREENMVGTGDTRSHEIIYE